MKRSYLFVPGNRPERFAKAAASGAGTVILDLEDAVPPEAKAEARNAVCNWLQVARGPRVERLAFGSVDFQLDAGIEGEDQAARLAQDVARARDLGFGAKLCIHPNQIEPVERGFAPTEAERRWAQAVVSAFEQARGSAVRLEGKLIDLPVVERARRLLA